MLGFSRSPAQLMAVPTGSRSPLDPADPGETMFFERRSKRRTHLLPSLVLGALVLGSGVLVTWAFTRATPKPVVAVATAPNASDGRPILTPEEARRLDSQTVPVAEPLASPPKPTPEVRRALPVNMPPPGQPAGPVVPGSFEEANASPLNTNLSSSENSQVKGDVLARVDLMPEVSQDNKDKLYAAVDRARGMGRIIAIPFDKGRLAIADADVEKLRRRAAAADIQKFTQDPTVVFVILGYADAKGDPKANYQLSLQRARSVLEALRDRCGFQNVMHAVGMGGSTLFSQKETDKNRVVEVWAVLP